MYKQNVLDFDYFEIDNQHVEKHILSWCLIPGPILVTIRLSIRARVTCSFRGSVSVRNINRKPRIRNQLNKQTEPRCEKTGLRGF